MAALLLPACASAQSLSNGFSDYATYQDPLLMLSGHVVPTSPLKPGLKELKVTPAYITAYSHFSEGTNQRMQGGRPFSDNEASGFGLAASWLQAINEHWGWSVGGAFSRMSGKTFAFGEHAANGSLVKRHDADETGTAFQASGLVIYDPFTGDGFRLPIFAGYGFLYQKQSADYSARSTVLSGNPTISFKADFTAFIPGAVLGASPQFNTGPLRWTPFVQAQFKNSSPSVQNTVKNETSGAVVGSQNFTNGDGMLISLGVGARYKPWDLGFTYIPNTAALLGGDEELGASVWTLSKTFRFGGD